MESNDLIKKNRKWIALGLLAIIIIMGIFVYNNRDDLFNNRVTITYPDGCVETFENTILVSDLCTEGRLQEEQIGYGMGQWETTPTINLTGINLT